MKILAVGPLWRGSNAGGLFRALGRKGCLIDVVDEFYYLSLQSSGFITKVSQKLIRPLQVKEYNNAIIKSLNIFKPAVLFVYKGAFVLPETLKYAKQRGIKLALFYPDVSMMAHGKYLPASIPLYDIVFTTKTFGLKDLENSFGVKNAFFIPHGFDPEIHRKLDIDETDMRTFSCDASFIGTWSPKKEQWLSYLKEKCPEIDLKIWGSQWYRSSVDNLKQSIQSRAVLGDMYAIAIQCSKINLGILSEQVRGASSGDLITSRTFHIPGSSGFMLHERNDESVQYYTEDVEAGFFNGSEELATQIKKYLGDHQLRTKVQEAGHQRALRDHSLDMRAETVINYLKSEVC